jgi:hypothetical protein
MPPREKASSFLRLARVLASSASETRLISAPWQMSRPARVRPARASPVSRCSKYASARSGMKLVPSQPSAISPVSASIFGDSVARYTGTGTGGRLTRIGLAPGNGRS